MESYPRYLYSRYMDDVIILAKARWQLRRAVRGVNKAFNRLEVEQAPDKTLIEQVSSKIGSTTDQESYSVIKRLMTFTMPCV